MPTTLLLCQYQVCFSWVCFVRMLGEQEHENDVLLELSTAKHTSTDTRRTTLTLPSTHHYRLPLLPTTSIHFSTFASTTSHRSPKYVFLENTESRLVGP